MRRLATALAALALATSALAQDGPEACYPPPTGDFAGVGNYLAPDPFVLRLDGHALVACEALLFNTDRAADHVTAHITAGEALAAETGTTVEWVFVENDEAADVAPWAARGGLIAIIRHVNPRMRILYVYATYGDRVTGERGVLITVHPF